MRLLPVLVQLLFLLETFATISNLHQSSSLGYDQGLYQLRDSLGHQNLKSLQNSYSLLGCKIYHLLNSNDCSLDNDSRKRIDELFGVNLELLSIVGNIIMGKGHSGLYIVPQSVSNSDLAKQTNPDQSRDAGTNGEEQEDENPSKEGEDSSDEDEEDEEDDNGNDNKKNDNDKVRNASGNDKVEMTNDRPKYNNSIQVIGDSRKDHIEEPPEYTMDPIDEIRKVKDILGSWDEGYSEDRVGGLFQNDYYRHSDPDIVSDYSPGMLQNRSDTINTDVNDFGVDNFYLDAARSSDQNGDRVNFIGSLRNSPDQLQIERGIEDTANLNHQDLFQEDEGAQDLLDSHFDREEREQWADEDRNNDEQSSVENTGESRPIHNSGESVRNSTEETQGEREKYDELKEGNSQEEDSSSRIQSDVNNPVDEHLGESVPDGNSSENIRLPKAKNQEIETRDERAVNEGSKSEIETASPSIDNGSAEVSQYDDGIVHLREANDMLDPYEISSNTSGDSSIRSFSSDLHISDF